MAAPSMQQYLRQIYGTRTALPSQAQLQKYLDDLEQFKVASAEAIARGEKIPPLPKLPWSQKAGPQTLQTDEIPGLQEEVQKVDALVQSVGQQASGTPGGPSLNLGSAFGQGQGQSSQRRPGQAVSDLLKRVSTAATSIPAPAPSPLPRSAPAPLPSTAAADRSRERIDDNWMREQAEAIGKEKGTPDGAAESKERIDDNWMREQAEAASKAKSTPAKSAEPEDRGFDNWMRQQAEAAQKGDSRPARTNFEKMLDEQERNRPKPLIIPTLQDSVIPFAPDAPAGGPVATSSKSSLPEGYGMMSRKKDQERLWGQEDEAVNKGETALPPALRMARTPTGPPPLPASYGMSLEKGLEPIKNLIQKITEQMDFDQPKYANANAPLTANLQSNLGSLPFVGQLTGAFAPLVRFSEALSQSYAIQKQNMDRYNIALVEHEKKLKAEFKAQGMSDTDAGDLAKRQIQMMRSTGAGASGDSTLSVLGKLFGGSGGSAVAASGATAGGTSIVGGAMVATGVTAAIAGIAATATVVVGAMAAVAATSMAVVDAFQSMVSTARKYVDVLSPATIFALDRAQRDLTATIGVAMLPVITVATGVIREFASVLLPIAQKIQPVVQRAMEMIGTIYSKGADFFGQLAEALMPVVNASIMAFEALKPLVNVIFAITDVAVNLLKPSFVMIGAAIQVLAYPFRIIGDVVASMTPALKVVSAVFSGIAEVLKSTFASIGEMLGLDSIKGFTDGLKASFEQLAVMTLKVVATMAKFFGADSFISGMIKGLSPEKKDATGTAVIQNPAITSLQEWSRKVATQSLMAGPGGDAQKRTSEQWLEDAVKSLKEIQTGQGDTITGAITRWWKDNGPSIVKLITETLRSGATESTYSTAGWLAERAAAAGKYGTAGAILGPVGAAIGSAYGAIRGE